MGASTFGKRERIVSRKLIERLFDRTGIFRNVDNERAFFERGSMMGFPLRAVYLPYSRNDSDETVQILVSVSKRHFKHAVDRNRVKRQVREAYRKHKQLLTVQIPETMAMAVAFIWMTNELMDSQRVEKAVCQLLLRIAKKVKE